MLHEVGNEVDGVRLVAEDVYGSLQRRNNLWIASLILFYFCYRRCQVIMRYEDWLLSVSYVSEIGHAAHIRFKSNNFYVLEAPVTVWIESPCELLLLLSWSVGSIDELSHYMLVVIQHFSI